MSYTCPKCGRTSYHPRDEVERYCGYCHQFAEFEPVAMSIKFTVSEEEIIGMLRMIQKRQTLIVDILTRMEQRQIEVKKEIEAEPTQGSFGAVNQ